MIKDKGCSISGTIMVGEVFAVIMGIMHKREGLPMFSIEELQNLDQKYFVIIVADPYDVTIMSRNTGHYWYLHNPEYPEDGTTIIFHRHRGGSTPYHLHGRADSLNRAVRSIQSHDRWQMKGRPRRKQTMS